MSIATLLGDAVRRNPYPLYTALRRVRPVLRDRAHDFWLLFDHASVQRALVDHETFSSRAAPPGGGPLDWMIFTDPPRHTKLRALVMRTFTPRAIAALEPRIRELAAGLLAPHLDRGSMDLVRDYADPLPLAVIMELLGMPPTDRERLATWTGSILGLGDTVAGGNRAARAISRYRDAKEDMSPYLTALLVARRAIPRDDLLSRLVAAEIDGERLSDDEIFDFFQLLLLAGSETTTNLIANAAVCFSAHPRQLAWVRADLARLPAAIEEVLRYRSPAQLIFRFAARDVTLHGRTIPKGKLVMAMIGSANRDERRFPNASQFDVTREPIPHVGFGHGIHFCLGAALARLEARVALEELLSRTDCLHVTNPKWAPRRAVNVHGPRALEVVLRMP